jgi:cystathionine gamma-lyase
MTHASVPAEQRALLGIDDSLIRLSVGVESCTDLIEDLKAALAAVTTAIEINGTKTHCNE